MKPNIIIEHQGGSCPYQAEGTVNDYPFYFRARGDKLQFNVNNIGENYDYFNVIYYYEEIYGVWPDAGFIDKEVVEEFISRASEKFVKEYKA
jgi:hypothetical protein